MTKPFRTGLRFALALPSWLRFSRFWCCHLAFCWRFSQLDLASQQCSRPKIQRIFSCESWHEIVPGILGKTVPQGRKCPSDLFQNNICKGRGETRNHTSMCRPLPFCTLVVRRPRHPCWAAKSLMETEMLLLYFGTLWCFQFRALMFDLWVSSFVFRARVLCSRCFGFASSFVVLYS